MSDSTQVILNGVRFLTIIAGIYLCVSVFLYFYQSRLIYAPSRQVSRTPETIGLGYRGISLVTEDGVRLSGWFVPAERPRATVLFCHGNAGNISDRLDTIAILNRLRLNTLIFDYRGYGDSGGEPSEKGTCLDAEAAWRWIEENLGNGAGETVIMGRSLGGAVALQLAVKHPPRALIVESSFTSIRDMGARLYPWLPVKLLARYTYPAEDYIGRVKCPVLVVHSPEDDVIPYEFGRRLFDAAGEPKEFLEISGNHNEGFLTSGEKYVEGIDRFISKYVQPGGGDK